MVGYHTPPPLYSTDPSRVETQQQLFRGEPCIQRFVEIGPRTILSTMAKRSASIQKDQRSSASCYSPEFLSYHDNQPEILYQYQNDQAIYPLSQPTQPQFEPTSPSHLTKRSPSPSKALPMSAIPSAELTLQAGHVILAMTAQKLRRRFDQVPVEKTIRDLSGGMHYNCPICTYF